jgi:recombination protein RecR
MKNRDSLMLPLAEDMLKVAHKIRSCTECGNFDTEDLCRICQSSDRDTSRICVVEDVADLWAMERAGVYTGRYHVLGGVMSAIDGVGPDVLRIGYLTKKAADDRIKEVILATSATVDGQTTSHYIAEKLASTQVMITRLAHGVPVGGELDYLDDGTLAQAMRARRTIDQ